MRHGFFENALHTAASDGVLAILRSVPQDLPAAGTRDDAALAGAHGANAECQNGQGGKEEAEGEKQQVHAGGWMPVFG